MFFSHSRRRRDLPVSLSGGHSHCSFAIPNTQFTACRLFSNKSSMMSLRYIFAVRNRLQRGKWIEYNLHKETMSCSFHYWRRPDSPGRLSGDDFHLAFIVCANFSVCILVLPNICNGKANGLGSLPIHKRKPHVPSTIGDDGIPQSASDAAISIRLLQ